MQDTIDQALRGISAYVPNLLGALALLVVGWIVASLVASAVRGSLRRTNLDNRLADAVGSSATSVEALLGGAVYWVIFGLVLIGFFQALNVPIVSQPLNQLISQVLAFIPRLASGAILLLAAWILATILRRLVTTALKAATADHRLARMINGDESPASAQPGTAPLAQTVGDVVYWLVFLLFLPAILGTLALEGILEPVQTMLDRILGFLPNVVAAAIILLVGWFVARVIQRIVTGLLAAVGLDALGQRVGLTSVLGRQSLSGLVGLVAYTLILIPVLVSALDTLAVEAISHPATNMLNVTLSAVPNIFAAALVLTIAYLVGRVVSGLLANLLAGVGFNTLPVRLGLSSAGAASVRTPAEIAGALIMVAIMLFASIEAVRLLGFTAIASLLAEFTLLAGQIVLGLVVLAVGLYLSNLAHQILLESGTANGAVLAQVARMSILALATAMALRQMGLANEIVNLAFGLLLGAIAVAVALAFGLGGREIAARELNRWIEARRVSGVTRDGASI